MQLQALRRDCTNKSMKVKKLWLLSGKGVKRLQSVGLKLSGMWLVLTFTFVTDFVTYLCMGSITGAIHYPALSTPSSSGTKESLSPLHSAAPEEEALMPPLLLPHPLATVLPIVFCHTCGSGKYSVPMLLQDT